MLFISTEPRARVLLRLIQALIRVGGEQGWPGGLDRLVGSIRALGSLMDLHIGRAGRPLGVPA